MCLEDIKKLKVDPLQPLSYLLQEDVSLQQSICGYIQEGSMLKYHVCLLIHITVNNNTQFWILLSLLWQLFWQNIIKNNDLMLQITSILYSLTRLYDIHT